MRVLFQPCPRWEAAYEAGLSRSSWNSVRPAIPVWMGKFTERYARLQQEIEEEIAKLDYFNDGSV